MMIVLRVTIAWVRLFTAVSRATFRWRIIASMLRALTVCTTAADPVVRKNSRPGSRRGPEPERDGVSAWRLVDLCDYVEQAYGVRYSQWGLSCLLKRLDLSRQKTRPSQPKGNPAVQAAFKKGAPIKAAWPRGGAP